MPGAEGPEQPGEDQGGHHGRGSQADHRIFGNKGLHAGCQMLCLSKKQLCFLQKHLSLLCGHQPFAEPVKQWHLKFLLQLPDHTGQTGLRHMQLLGCTGDIAVFTDNPEILQLF